MIIRKPYPSRRNVCTQNGLCAVEERYIALAVGDEEAVRASVGHSQASVICTCCFASVVQVVQAFLDFLCMSYVRMIGVQR
jgi:hypothetical protein